MTPEALQRFALSLPETHAEPHFERTSYRVAKRIFATMTRDGVEAMVNASVPDIEALLSTQPDVFFSYGTWTTRNGALGVRLARVDPKLMQRLVTDAWKHVASKRALAALDGARPTPRRRDGPSRHE